MRFSLKFKIIVFVVVLINLAVIVVGLVARRELSDSISKNTQQIMELNVQKSAQILRDVNKKEFYLLDCIANLPFVRDENVSLEEKVRQLSAVAASDPVHFENLAFYNDKNTGEMWSRIEGADLEFINFAEAYQFILTNKIPVYNMSQGSWQKEIQEYKRSK